MANGSAASYRVVEDPSSLVSFEATGETTDMAGWAEISDSTITKATFSTEVRSIVSDQPSRDRIFHNEVLEADRFPTIDFALLEPIELGTIPAAGGELSTTVVGSLTLHGVTRRVTFPADAAVTEDRVDVVGTIDITMEDFDIKPLDTAVLRVKDQGTVSIELLLARP